MHDPCKKAAARTNCPKGGLGIEMHYNFAKKHKKENQQQM